MKPNDLLQAIGDVDEALVKRAHRKDLLRALIASSITLLVGICVTCFLMQPTRILTRIHPNFTVNTGYIDPMHLEGNWTSLEQTDYRDGQVIATSEFRQMLYGGRVSVTHTTETGAKELVYLSSGDTNWQEDYLYQGKDKIPYIDGMYTEDLIGRIDSMAIHAQEGYNPADVLLNYVRIEYLQNGLGDNWVIKQSKLDENGIVIAYRTYDYTNSRLARTQDYTQDGLRIGYVEYSYDGYLCTEKKYEEDGTLIGSSHIKTDWLGRLRWRESFDSAGNLVSREVYRYRFWELYRGIEGWTTVFILLVLTLTMGIYINDAPDTIREREKARKKAENKGKELPEE